MSVFCFLFQKKYPGVDRVLVLDSIPLPHNRHSGFGLLPVFRISGFGFGFSGEKFNVDRRLLIWAISGHPGADRVLLFDGITIPNNGHSGFGFQVSDFRFQVSGFWFWISGFGFRVPGVGFAPLSL